MQDRFGLKPENYILYKSLVGDKSDNIPGIKGLGQKTLEKRLPILFGSETITMDQLIDYAEKNKDQAKVIAEVANNRKLLELNYKLMQLEEVEISGQAKESIRNIVNGPMQRLVKFEILKYILEDRMTIVKNPEFWLKESFHYLDAMSAIDQ